VREPAAFVLVHGAWCGGFIWRGVADRLRTAGHRVFTPTLTGLADRSHLLSPEIDLATHIADVVNLVHWESLHGFVLVGHSYGGMVINGVAEALPEGTIRSIVFLDACVPLDGESTASIEKPFAEAFDCDPVPFLFTGQTGNPDFEALTTPHPSRTLHDRARVTGKVEAIARKHYILATSPAMPFFVETVARLRGEPGWQVNELPCSHGTMPDMPDETTRLLLNAAV
jgi:pimeloyl-ACP methyl ester carboxylesterase